MAVTRIRDAQAIQSIDLTSEVTGTLPVGNGGVGAATLAANNVLLGNGTSALQVVAPSTSGNVLTSNGTTWASTAQAVNNVKAYGAVGNGSTDDTTAINNAITAGGVTFFPAGTYIHTGLALPSGAYLQGVGSGFYATASGTGQRSILKMKNATNATSVSVAAGNSYGRIEDLEIDGNKANQTTAGVGLSFTDAGAAEECGWELRRIQVYNSYGEGVYVGSNRQALYAEHVLVTGTGQHGVHIAGSDSTWIKLMVGACGSGWKGVVAGGWMTRFIGGEVWSQPSGCGMIVVGPMASIIGMGFDRNDQEGIYLDTGADTVTISGCTFHSNSQQTNNTYSDINVAVAGNFTIVGNNFAALDGGITNKRKYAVQVGANTAIATGNTHVAAATGTAFTDHPAQLVDSVLGVLPARSSQVTNTTSWTINSDIIEYAENTGLTGAVTLNNPTGTPTVGRKLWTVFQGTASRAISYGTAFEDGAVVRPTTTTGTQTLDIGWRWNSVTSKWRCMASGSA